MICPCINQPGFSEFGCVCPKLNAHQVNEQKLEQALHLIKLHIGPEEIAQNHDLHNAIQLIVDVARYHGMLTR